jgi:isopenicillin-N epimerase
MGRVRSTWAARFPLRSELVMFNHASYGLPTRDLLERSEAVRRDLESDPNVNLGDRLLEQLDEVLVRLCAELDLDADHTALTTSAAAGAAALQRSVPLGRGDLVVTLDCEYSSVLRGWQRRCAEVGAELLIIPVDLPLLDAEALLARMTTMAAGRPVAVLAFSAISSSAALRLPVDPLAAWGHERGATVIVDAAHAPGQLDLGDFASADALFASVHKWLPVPRSVGLLRATPALAAELRPAEVSLTYDAAPLNRRFSWPGTFDPTPRLVLPAALDQHIAWTDAGELERCVRLADHAGTVLTGLGAVPTAAAEFRAPRMRAFLLAGVAEPELRRRLLDADLRVWTGVHGPHSLLRLATHVYNDEADVAALAAVVTAAIRSRGPV